MSRFFSRGLWLVWLGLLASVAPAIASSFVGIKEATQTDVLGYSRVHSIVYPDIPWIIDTAPEWTYAPKNIGEEYRWNIPTLYYTYDPGFLTYFGSNGVQAIDSAFTILNNISNVDLYSPDLSEVPVEESRFNYTAQALLLFDLKSAALEMMMPRLGLADPEYFTWCLRSRFLPPGLQCPDFEYVVIQRNFDPVTLAPSTYVNGNLFTYQIVQYCPGGFDWGEAVELLVDPIDIYKTAVASPKVTFPNVNYYGMFHSTLTRDDVGALRHLYSTNTIHVEPSATNVLQFVTNNLTSLLFSSNLNLFASQALTNDAPTLQALYPNLLILSSTNFFTNVVTTNLVAYFTNYPFDPIGTPPHLAFTTTTSVNVQTLFNHTLGNLVTFTNYNGHWATVPLLSVNNFTNHSLVTVQSFSVTNSPYSTGTNTFVTNVTSRTYSTNGVYGEYAILPTNLCDVAIVASQLTNVFQSTNLIVGTNFNGQSFTQAMIVPFTNHVFVTYAVNCLSNTIAARRGLQKITFVRHDFDSLINRFFQPITNDYTIIAVTNNQNIPQRFRRIVVQPDILIAAQDLAVVGNDVETVDHFGGQPNFNTNAVAPGQNGPGTIEGPTTLTFNKVGAVRLNAGFGNFVTEQSAIFFYNWASFDATTNPPVAYPVGTTIQDLENELIIQVSPGSLPPATENQPYSVTLSASGGQAPYSWSVGPGSPRLPNGLSLSQIDSTTARLSGIPTTLGTFSFWIQATDAAGRNINQLYVLNITP